uniref:PDZ domain-containing protein n=1 Tax=Panagrolaimus superbus TaxID=310955 RepID=A0A914YU02_9BILA
MKREGDGGDEGAADDRPIFRATNDRKFDDSPMKAADDPIRREFNEIVSAANIANGGGENYIPQDMTAKIAAESAESLAPLPSSTERLELDIDLEDDLNLGIKVNDKLFVEGFKKMGLQESKFTIGDQITAVNARNLRSAAHFQKLLQKYGPHVRISVYRPMYTTKAHQFRLNKHGLTAAVIKNSFAEDQFLIAHISYRPSIHLGLSINSYDGCVVVSRVDKDSLAYRRFEIGDIIVDVEGEIVHDKNEFRNYMMDAMDRNSYASVLIQRPFSQKSVSLAKTALGLNQKDPRDPPFPHDAMIIGRKEMQRFKAFETNNNNKRGIRSILNSSPSAHHHLVISDEKPAEIRINSDIPEGKKLTPCPTRAQLHARLRAKLGKKNKKNTTKAEREIIYSSMDANSPDTYAPPILTATATPEIKPKEESLLRRAQDSWKEKRSKMFNSGKKDTDSESSSRRTKSKKKVFEKEQISDRKNSNSDKSVARKDGSDRRKPLNDDGSDKKKKVFGGDDASERRYRNEDGSERQQRRRIDDSGKKRKQRQM